MIEFRVKGLELLVYGLGCLGLGFRFINETPPQILFRMVFGAREPRIRGNPWDLGLGFRFQGSGLGVNKRTTNLLPSCRPSDLRPA